MKKALFIDINYKNTQYETYNEVSIFDVANLMKKIYSYDDQIILSESGDIKPTKNNIISNLNKLAEESKNSSEIWIHYMGHSTNIIDEKTEYIERGLLPIDFETENFIEDKTLKEILFKFKCKLYVFLDCCYGNYGLNIGHSVKMIEGKFIKEDNMTKNVYPKNKCIFIISMYLNELKFRKYNFKMCNLLSRRFCQFLIKENYTLSQDKITMRFHKSLHDENYICNTAVLSSNIELNGRELFLSSDQSIDLNMKYNLEKTDEEIKKEKIKLIENRTRTFFLSIGRIDMCNNFKQKIDNTNNSISKFSSTRSKSLEPKKISDDVKNFDEFKKNTEKKHNTNIKFSELNDVSNKIHNDINKIINNNTNNKPNSNGVNNNIRDCCNKLNVNLNNNQQKQKNNEEKKSFIKKRELNPEIEREIQIQLSLQCQIKKNMENIEKHKNKGEISSDLFCDKNKGFLFNKSPFLKKNEILTL